MDSQQNFVILAASCAWGRRHVAGLDGWLCDVCLPSPLPVWMALRRVSVCAPHLCGHFDSTSSLAFPSAGTSWRLQAG